MRKWLLNFHLYGGLLCAPYLIIFGFSSLHFNHHFGFIQRSAERPPLMWEAPLKVSALEDNDSMAESVRDSLGLMGWTLPWKTKRDAAGDLTFDLERPGKSYTVQTQLKNGSARVEERSKGLWQVINSLHAMGAVPNSRFSRWWGGYTEVCTGFVLFAAVSGVSLWVNSKRERRIGLAALALAVLFSCGLMFIVIVSG